VLAVDDDAAARKLIANWLTKSELQCLEASSGESALEIAERHAESLDAIVLDVSMPGIDGFETIARLKANLRTAHIPIVIVTAHATGEQDIVRGVETGAVDHVTKPFSGPVLVAKVRAMAERTQAERQLRSKLASAEQNACSDALTRLYNRRHFEERLREASAHCLRHREPLAVVVVDLDHFKSINDTHGHDSGDRVLVHVADIMRSVFRAEDTVFRYGGEEFVLLLRCDARNAARATERLRQALRATAIRLAGEDRVVTFSAGIAAAAEANGFRVEDLVARADEALYRAKRAGRDRTALEES
jgi:diguanylate cyclase (GGDEF)-like protein